MRTSTDSTTLDEVVVLELGPEYHSINEALIAPLQALFEERLGQAAPQAVVLDLSQVTWACSSFLGLLARWWRVLADRGGTRTAVCGVNAAIRERLAVTGLRALWSIFDEHDAAVAALQGE